MDHCKHVSKIRPAWNTSILNPQKWLCYVCGTTESAWACLSCANVACGRFNQEHALKHYQESKHPICIEVNEKYVYCYECDDYVLNDNAAGDLKLLRSALSAIATQSFTDIESRGKRLLRSYSHSGLISRTTTDEDDKLATALWHRRQALLHKVVRAWKNVVQEERKSKRTPKKEREPAKEPAFSPLIKKPTIYPGITGLRNLGNTCYMNSVIQVLSHIEEFRQFYLNLMFDADNSPQITQQNSVKKSSTESPVRRTPTRRSSRLSTIECFEHLMSPLSSKSHNSRRSHGSGGLNGGATPTTPNRKQQLICTVESQQLSQNVSLCHELHGLLRVLWSGKWAQVSPYAFLSSIWHAIPMFKGYAQHDAQEFLCELLDKVQQELDASTSMKRTTSRCNQPSPSSSRSRSSSRQQKLYTPGSSTSWQQSSTATPEKQSISQWFQGELVSKVTCLECGNESQRFEPYMDLSLEFPKRYQITGTNSSLADDICHITEMLAKFTEEERLEGKIYTCEKCNNNRKSISTDHKRKSVGKDQQTVYTEAKKQLLIHKLPQILRLHLKRFRWSGRLHREKINTHVAVDDLLDLMPFCSQPTNGKKVDYEYKLTGLIMHHGKGFGSGHYTAYVWNNEAASWVHCNDSRLQMVTQEDVLQAQAYIVFYKQNKPQDIPEDEPLAVPLEYSESSGSGAHKLKCESVNSSDENMQSSSMQTDENMQSSSMQTDENMQSSSMQTDENMQSSSMQTDSNSSTSGNSDSKVNVDNEITFKFPSPDTVPFELQRRKRTNKSSTNDSSRMKRRRSTFW